MKKTRTLFTVLVIGQCVITNGQVCFTCADTLPGTIFCDDFSSTTPLSDRYFEYGDNGGDFVPVNGVGRDGSRGMRVVWQAGTVGAGGFKKSFGRTPGTYIGNHAVKPNADFVDIYWRIDLRTQPGWHGGGADKLSRAITLANSNWAQGMIAHIWSSGANNEFLAIDPASGIDVNGNLVSTGYNDFANLRWLGLQVGNIDLFSTANSGKWYCVEAHAKLNTVGIEDGIFEFWINDTLQAGTYGLNWHSNWNADTNNFNINAIFIENYWNNGSPVEQERYLDNFVISTQRIGCACANTTSVSETEFVDQITVYPNPTANYLNIKVDKATAMHGYTVELIDASGRSIFTSGKIGSLIYVHKTDSYAAGTYYYKIDPGTTRTISGKFVVRH